QTLTSVRIGRTKGLATKGKKWGLNVGWVLLRPDDLIRDGIGVFAARRSRHGLLAGVECGQPPGGRRPRQRQNRHLGRRHHRPGTQRELSRIALVTRRMVSLLSAHVRHAAVLAWSVWHFGFWHHLAQRQGLATVARAQP